jgi:aspartate racemase
MAGVELHKKIIENTDVRTDQNHFRVYHISRSPDVPDRSEYLKGIGLVNPAEGMYRSLQAIIAGVRTVDNREIVFGVPCNTFQAKPVWNRFLELSKKDKGIYVVNMIDETKKFIDKYYPGIENIGLMSTTGTRDLGVYKELLEPKFKILQVPKGMQDELHRTIYDPDYGIKAQSTPVSRKARENFLNFAEIIKEQGAEAVILGCTEIPLALPEKQINGIPLVDPMDALARALVREANPDKLKQYKPIEIFHK